MKKIPGIVVLTNMARRRLRGSARPTVLVNMAMTADGKIATANKAVTSFGSRMDLNNLYALRATADAVACGARTVETGEVSLGPGPARYQRLRRARGLAAVNLRVVVSGTGSVGSEAAVFKSRSSPVIVLTTERASIRRLKRLGRLADEVVVCGRYRLDWHSALSWLREEWEVRRLLVEGGGELNASLFAAQLVDELHVTICPYVFGGRKAPTLAEGEDVTTLAAAASFMLAWAHRVGAEVFCVFRPAKSKSAGASNTTHSPRQCRSGKRW